MILAAIDWLSISINLLLVVFVVVCLLMTLLILMQRPKQEGLGAAFGGGVTDQVFGARTTNVLQRGTVYLGSLFFLISLTLALLIGHKNKKTTLLEEKTPAAKVEQAADKPADAASDQPKSLVEELPADSKAADSSPIEITPVPEGETPAPADQPAPPADQAAPPADQAAPPADQAAPPADQVAPPADQVAPPADAAKDEEKPAEP